MASHIVCLHAWLAGWLPIRITQSIEFLYLIPGKALAMIHNQDSVGSLA